MLTRLTEAYCGFSISTCWSWRPMSSNGPSSFAKSHKVVHNGGYPLTDELKSIQDGDEKYQLEGLRLLKHQWVYIILGPSITDIQAFRIEHIGILASAIWLHSLRNGKHPLAHFCQKPCVSWWRHQLETFSALLAICAGNSPVPDEFPAQRPVTRSFDVSFHLHPNKRLSKQWWGWWFETP